MLSSGRRFTPFMPPFLFHQIVFVSAYLRLLHCLRNKILVECEADTNWNYAESRWPNDSTKQHQIMRNSKSQFKCLKIPSAECCHTPAAAEIHDIPTSSTKEGTTTSSNHISDTRSRHIPFLHDAHSQIKSGYQQFRQSTTKWLMKIAKRSKVEREFIEHATTHSGPQWLHCARA